MSQNTLYTQNQEMPQLIGGQNNITNQSMSSINQPIDNPTQHLVQNDLENQANIDIPRPEIVYCCEQVQLAQKYENQNEVKGKQVFFAALKLVKEDLNLNLGDLQLIGKCNLFSDESFEQNVIQPILNNNQHIPQQQIRKGKLIFCCNYLHQNATFMTKSLKVKYLFTFLYQSILIYLNSQLLGLSFKNIGIQIGQLLIQIMSYILFLNGMQKCQPSSIKHSLQLCLLYTFSHSLLLVYQFYKIAEDTTPKSWVSSFIFGYQFCLLIYNYFKGKETYEVLSLVQMKLLRLWVLLKQIDVSHIDLVK